MGESQGDSDHMRRQGSTGSSSKSGELSATSNSDNLGIVYQGVVFHVGVNSVGHQFCHLRYLRVRGKYVEMFKRDPMAHPSEKPIRRGVVGQFLVVEELGRQKVNDMDLYVLKISSRVDDKRMGQIACITAEDARNWKAAFQQAKEEAEADLRVGSGHRLIDETNEFKLDGHRPRIRQYARGWSKLITIGTGLRDFFAANPELAHEALMTTLPKEVDRPSGRSLDVVDTREAAEEFYDAIAAEVPGEEDEDSDSEEKKPKVKVRKLKNIVWSLMLGISAKRRPALEENGELMLSAQPTEINITHFKGTLSPAVGNKGSNCWADPGGKGFMVRGKTYLKDNLKVPASDPLLKLLAVDWFVSEKKVGLVAAHPKCLVQSEAGKELPFILCINLQVPANPNYNLVLYFGAERPIRKGSLLDKFANGDDMFRDAHFKLIPSIVEGYWVVKRAVGTKACLLGRAVNCSYHRQGNFLEIDVDISSSSVAKSVTSFVFGYVASIVVDLAFLIEGKDEHELPEYLLGTARINRIRLESAVPFWTEPDTDTVSKGES
eukprot:c26651_g1_i2 orf=256-1899(+)